MAKVQDSTNLNTPNILIVDSAGHAGYTTIASAITAATDMALVNPVIYIRSGTYTENLVLVNGIIFEGANRNTVTIDGSHTVPAAGLTYFRDLTLQQSTPATNIFVEAGAGTCSVRFSRCNINITSGMLLNLPLSTGQIIIEDCADSSTQNSIIDNTTGKSTLIIVKSSLGVGAVSALIAGTTSIEQSTINTPCTFSSNSVITVTYSTITKEITLSDTAAFAVYNSRFNTGAAAAVTIGATATANLSNVVIYSTAGNAVTGTGSCTYGEVTFLGTLTHNVTTEVYTTRMLGGGLQLGTTNAGVLYSTAGVVGSTAALTDGQLLIGNTGNVPSVATLTGAGTVSVTNAAGSITITGAAGVAGTFIPIAADGAMTTNTRYINTKAGLLSLSLPAVSAEGDILNLQGNGAGGWILTQAANQQILVGNTNTTLGVAGTLASTNFGDAVSLVCVTPNLVWRTFSSFGNLTVV